MQYEEEFITLKLTSDEFDIIFDAIKNIVDTSYFDIGFNITLTSLMDKLVDTNEMAVIVDG